MRQKEALNKYVIVITIASRKWTLMAFTSIAVCQTKRLYNKRNRLIENCSFAAAIGVGAEGLLDGGRGAPDGG